MTPGRLMFGRNWISHIFSRHIRCMCTTGCFQCAVHSFEHRAGAWQQLGASNVRCKMVAQQFENRAGTRAPLDASTLFLSGKSGASASLGVSNSMCGTKWTSHNLKTEQVHMRHWMLPMCRTEWLSHISLKIEPVHVHHWMPPMYGTKWVSYGFKTEQVHVHHWVLPICGTKWWSHRFKTHLVHICAQHLEGPLVNFFGWIFGIRIRPDSWTQVPGANLPGSMPRRKKSMVKSHIFGAIPCIDFSGHWACLPQIFHSQNHQKKRGTGNCNQLVSLSCLRFPFVDSHQSSNHKRIRKIVANRWQPPSSENCWHVGIGWHASLWTNVWNMNIITILWNWLTCDMWQKNTSTCGKKTWMKRLCLKNGSCRFMSHCCKCWNWLACDIVDKWFKHGHGENVSCWQIFEMWKLPKKNVLPFVGPRQSSAHKCVRKIVAHRWRPPNSASCWKC